MKKIYVTVAEFLENGGKLRDHKLYEHHDSINSYREVEVYLDGFEIYSLKDKLFIEINCTPIYK